MSGLSLSAHQISRVRRDTRRRVVKVTDIVKLTPKMRRIRFASPDLHDFGSLSPDDHIKVFPPAAEDGEVCMRDYTPRAFDPAQGTLTIDFALHEAGPATAWALAARVGDDLEIGGPRGSLVVADDFDWYLLVGDETALPAIGRRIEELRPGVPVTSIVLVDSDAERQVFAARSDWTPLWVSRDGKSLDDTELLLAALSSHVLPQGAGYVWIAAEASVARALRSHVADTMGHPRAWLRASGYWTSGEANAHESIGD